MRHNDETRRTLSAVKSQGSADAENDITILAQEFSETDLQDALSFQQASFRAGIKRTLRAILECRPDTTTGPGEDFTKAGRSEELGTLPPPTDLEEAYRQALIAIPPTTDLSVDCTSERVAQLEEQLEWLKNNSARRSRAYRKTQPRARKNRQIRFGRTGAKPVTGTNIARIMRHAQLIERNTKEPGKKNGVLGATGVLVLNTLLCHFQNFKTGECYPSLDRIAKICKLARSTVACCINRLESSEILTVFRRLNRIRDRNNRVVAVRTSNGYGCNLFILESHADYSKSEHRTESANEVYFNIASSLPDDLRTPAAPARTPKNYRYI